MLISDWSSDVCSSDLLVGCGNPRPQQPTGCYVGWVPVPGQVQEPTPLVLYLHRRVAPRLPPIAFTPFVEIHAAFAVEIPGSRIRRATGAMSQANVFWRGDVTGFFDGWAMVLVADRQSTRLNSSH